MYLRCLIHICILPTFLAAVQGRATCYYPDGTVAANDWPCKDSGGGVECCSRGYACLDNGLCVAPDPNPALNISYIRSSCTDKSWKSSSCPNFCTSNHASGGALMYACDASAASDFCCDNGRGYYACCSDKANILDIPAATAALTLAGVPTVITLEKQTSTAQGAPDAITVTKISASKLTKTQGVLRTTTVINTESTSNPTSATSSDTPTPNSSSGLSTGAKAGIGIGVALGVVLIALNAALAYLFLRRRSSGPVAEYDGTANVATAAPEALQLNRGGIQYDLPDRLDLR
ncbi:hypothetical protein NA57DRAFT_62225 [Rhizodiscina lignyota]|uniref:Mid2 domain-containing protein n=1 Tax=Rhizodiscina lignyota TaxID=1504668 RepID=A0A9P4I6I6_9PEZI|nr:hypothetical protein NA57DRAFT_62225 [Rhizodiscina lignyota]